MTVSDEALGHRGAVVPCRDCTEDDGIAWHRDEERRLTARITELSAEGRATLAALTVARLQPYFLRFHAETGRGDPRVLGRALADVWRKLDDGTSVTLPVMLAAFDQLQIAADAPGALADLAWYSAASVTNACHAAVHGEVREPLHCLRYGREAALTMSWHATGGTRSACRHDTLLQEELRLQSADLDLVASS